MAYYTRKTFNENFGQHPLGGNEPSWSLQFLRRRRRLGGAFTTLSFLAAPFTGGATLGVWGGYKASMWALSVPFEVGRGVVQTARFFEKLGQDRPEYATQFVDTRQAYTMRQAALHAMHDSAYSIRSAIGSEARLLHS